MGVDTERRKISATQSLAQKLAFEDVERQQVTEKAGRAD
jgi:hypothetical protein